MISDDFEELFTGRRRESNAESFYRDLLGLRSVPRPPYEDQPNPTAPLGLTLVDHFHKERTCRENAFVDASAVSAMKPSTMDPGFLTTSGTLAFDTALDKKLVDLLVDDREYKKFLHPDSVRTRTPSARDPLRVALVDLSGNKLCRPGFAGWGSTRSTGGASTAKIAIIYAAHQLIFDLNEISKREKCTTAAQLRTAANDTAWKALTCKPRIDDLATITDGSPVTVAMSQALTTALATIVTSSSGTPAASNTLLRIGFEYVASLLWQSGLRHPDRKGLWLHNAYVSKTEKALFNAKCHAGDSDRLVSWASDPLKETGIVLTALSVATFFTLLAQRRLGDAATSAAIERELKPGCTIRGIAGSVLSGSVRAAKCGAASGFLHDALLVERGTRRYVLVYLTKDLPMSETLRRRFITDLDKLIP